MIREGGTLNLTEKYVKEYYCDDMREVEALVNEKMKINTYAFTKVTIYKGLEIQVEIFFDFSEVEKIREKIKHLEERLKELEGIL